MAKPFMIEVQGSRLSKDDQSTFKRLLAKYLEGSRIPKEAGISAAGSTLSNCKDTDTECTCETDD